MQLLKGRIALAFMLCIVFAGCGAPGFNIVQVNDKFSDSQEPLRFLGQNNRLSTKSSHGGSHLDSKGVYIDPYAHKDRLTGAVKSVGFYITHVNFGVDGGFRPIEEIIFLTDKNERVVLKVKDRDQI